MTADKLPVRVAAKRIEAEGICSFKLEAADSSALPPFTAGAHVNVHLPNGMTRQYSLCNNPSDTRCYIIAVLNAENSRGGSRALHDDIQPEDVLQIGTPRNNFPLASEATHSILLGGGIGITPLLSMSEFLFDSGASFELHYCTRSKGRTAFYETLSRAPYSNRVQFHFDDGTVQNHLDIDKLLSSRRSGAHLYVCGPQGFIDYVLSSATRHAWPKEALHYEFFSTQSGNGTDEAFDIKLARSGRLLHVRADQTVAEVLREAGIEIATSCEQGVCGVCITKILEGIPEHRDIFLTPDEQAKNDQFTPCCSRAKSSLLVLDL